MTDPVNKLISIFSDFPGIGPKQARRFVYYLLTRSSGYIDEMQKLITELKKEIAVCPECFRYFPKTNPKNNLCNICSDQDRNEKSLMIVSRDVDFENIEKSKSFDGKYFILGGSIPVLDKNPEERVRIKEMLSKVERTSKLGLKEVILGLDANTEGEYTEQYIKEKLSPLASKYTLKISVLGRGLSTGTELEYSDSDTIKNALKNRQ